MIISIAKQLQCFIFSITAGIITGVLFDIYKVIRGYGKINKFVSFFEDLLFWILAAIIVFIFLIITDYIYIGFYVYMLIVIGIYIYIKLFSKWFVRIWTNILKAITKGFRIFKNVIVYPFALLAYNIKIKIKKNYKK
ncbi:spore cortex biosynthesis protein YabQ [Clostridium fermenticellae]|uniref:Spore cortex biosynthesis protein YabQ n=1 Tax=Clostridium fermenticellae TaxID=2068654 RepID=A0A386H6A1_9CLOT|nr:spore cortex biosynthesis protein YabQ [Clostridium fermenticellae]AYD41277.1 spore cortex biosynthesis protein YabQ [Clostridium fermenticellae]